MNPATAPTKTQPESGFPYVAASILVLLVAFIYWPVHQALFVWDDKLLIHDNASLSVGIGWRTIVLHGFTDWKYFRPMGVALFVAEIRWFGIDPGPMHLLSLTLHLINTSMVGMLAWRLCPRHVIDANLRRLICCAMLVYGLHPVLVEPVAWIASQFDLLLTLFMLLGLLLNLTLRRTCVRAPAVAACFFIAACSKESALAFPIVLVLLDWLDAGPLTDASSWADRLRAQLRRQWLVYLGVFAAGIAYLTFRFWARLDVAPAQFDPFLTWQRFQVVCHTYMSYWRMIVWPFAGLSPHHIISTSRFLVANGTSLMTDFAAVAIGIVGSLLAWRRNPVGILIVGVTATVFPVLHIIPVGFDESLFHERYAMPAIALSCALLPAVVTIINIPPNYKAIASRLSFAVSIAWLLLAALTVRTTIPLWFDDTRNWEWSLRSNPGSVFVMDNLLDVYINKHDLGHATELANILMVRGQSCADCMMDAANLALQEGDAKRAAETLRLADVALNHTIVSHTRLISYLLLNGNLHQLEHDEAGAEEAYRGAISIDPMRPDGYIDLALSLARQGKSEEAQKVFDKGMSLSAPDQIDTYREFFRKALAKGATLPSKH